MNIEARKRMTVARTTLILDQPFFGVLVLKLKLVEDPSCPTAWVDGVSLGYNPDFVLSLSAAQALALVAHEVMHPAMGHPWRRGNRDHRRANEAMDRAINPVLRESRFQLPDGCLFELEPSHHGKSFEWIYDRLPPPPPSGDRPGDQPGGPGDGDDARRPAEEGDDPNPFGECRDAPTGSDQAGAPSEEEWRQAVKQAADAAKARGKLPGSLERLASEATESRVDWRSALRRFVQEVARADYSWNRPNPRYLAQGLYLPALRSEEMGPVVFVDDTSGSVDAVELAQWHAEIRAVVSEMRPRRVHVIYADSRVQRIDTFEQNDPLEFHPVGGGGTDFRPAIAAAEELEEPPVCLIYLTDLAGRFPEVPPSFPVLWATASRAEAPFGETVRIT